MHETEIVSALRTAVAEQVGSHRFDLWFAETDWRYEEGRLYIQGPCEFRLNRLKNRLHGEIRQACSRILDRPPNIEYAVLSRAEEGDGGLSSEPQPDQATTHPKDAAPRKIAPSGKGTAEGGKSNPTASNSSPSATLRTRPGQLPQRSFATWETMVVGSSNQIAVASARMVLEQPGRLNPFFVYGPPGSGKSHLLESVWTEIRKKSSRVRCVYLTAEQFTSFFVSAIQGGGIPSFRQRYRNTHFLVIEDLQFLINKRATVAELQYTMDAVQRDGGQLIFSADRSPTELSHLGTEIVTRLCGGLVAKLDSLDLTTRRKLLEQLARERGVEVHATILDWLASQLAGDARLLSGAIARIQAYTLAWGRPVTLHSVQDNFKDLIRHPKPRLTNLADVERAVCEVFGIDAKKLRSSNRTQRISQPRMLAMWLARRHTSSALSEIGEYFGHRSHSTVISAEKKVNSLLAQKTMLRVHGEACVAEEAIQRIERLLSTG